MLIEQHVHSKGRFFVAQMVAKMGFTAHIVQLKCLGPGLVEALILQTVTLQSAQPSCS
jgi:hypothetical protein